MSQNRREFTKALYQFDAVVQRVPEEAWSNPSPCDGWSAADVVVHEASVVEALNQMVRTNQVHLPEMATDVEHPVELWNAARDDVLESLDQSGVLRQHGSYWWGEMSVDELIGVTAWDPFTHSWDLSKAAGIDHVADHALAEHCIANVEGMLPTLKQYGLVQDPVEIDSAEPTDRFLAMIGRDPRAW